MSKEAEWLAQFTGLDVATGAGTGEPDPAEQARAFADLQLRKQALLAEARRELAQIKAEFQKAMTSEVTIKGKRQKEKLLEIEKTQASEAEFEEIDFGSIELEPATQATIAKGQNRIINVHERLKAATIELDGKEVPLFDTAELQREYWTPLVRERILPETFVGAIYSETQQMLDATNEAYEAAVAEKAAKGELTPRADRRRDILDSGAELLSIAGSLAGGVGGSTREAKLAATVLTTASRVVSQSANVVDTLKAKEYADASSLALGVIKDIAGSALSAAGVPAKVVSAVESGFGAGDAAIKAGKAFAAGADGAGEGSGHIAALIEAALGSAIAVTSGPHQDNLKKAVAVVPALFRQGQIVAELRQKIIDEDAKGIVECLVATAQNAFTSVRGFQRAEATAGKSEEEAEAIGAKFDTDTESLAKIVNTGGAGAAAAVKFALLAKQGQYLKGMNGLVQDIAEGLSDALQAAGIDEDQAETIAALYTSAASAPAAFECLARPTPDVQGAMAALAGGVSTAFGSIGGDDPALKAAGEALAQSIALTAKGAPTLALFKQGKVDEGVAAFIDTVQGGLAGALKVGQLATKDGETDPTAVAVLEHLQQAGAAVAARKELVAERVDRAVKQAKEKKSREEVDAIMQEAKDDLEQMAAAEKAGADASAIDTLIAKMERDRMVMRLAVQIMEGGSAFLAKFVPGIGAAGAAAQLAAQMYAAAMRAQQLYRWTQNQSDLEAAQSALSTSAQNFVKNQGEQFAHYSIQSALQAAKLVAEVGKVSGMAAPAAAALGAVAEAGQSLQNIIEQHVKREKLEEAWKVTAAALRNPTNRKLGLKARALNPTLAKYSIAWGAVTLKDPLARNAMRACDLTEATLKNENSNVGKVVEYLEKFYEDDAKLYRELEEKADWLPKDLAIGLRSWSQLKRNAKQAIGLDTGGTGRIDGLLAEWDTLEAARPPEEDDLAGRRSAIVARRRLLQQLDRALGEYEPKLAGSRPNPKALELMGNALKLLQRQARGSLKALDADEAEVAAREAELAPAG